MKTRGSVPLGDAQDWLAPAGHCAQSGGFGDE